MSSYRNPIISGFYPDPSCVLVGDTFYMVNSSFQFFPGIPIHASKDLVNWEFIGNAICRTSQLDLGNAVTKENNIANREIFTAGIYAPTIRHHNGIFYIVCTNLYGDSNWAGGCDFSPVNFLITSSDLSNSASFSDPMQFEFQGIDPSLFFDDDDRVYVQGSWIYGYNKSPATTIMQFEIDVETGAAKSPITEIWDGHSGIIPEGPHMYKKDGFYYLIIAEGGTHHGHRVTMARSRCVWGPFEGCPKNPLLSAPRPSDEIQCIGHAELFQDTQGQWWAVALARREYGFSYPLGRETYLSPVDWPENEFPTISLPETRQFCDRQMARRKIVTWKEQVNLQSSKTLFLRSPDLTNYAQIDASLLLYPSNGTLTAAQGTVSFVGQRQESYASTAAVTVFPKSIGGDCHIGLVAYKDTFRHASLQWKPQTKELTLTSFVSSTHYQVHNTIPLPNCESLTMKIVSSQYGYEFLYSFDVPSERMSENMEAGRISADILSGDDFTGTIFGIFASGSGQPVEFAHFVVEHDLQSEIKH